MDYVEEVNELEKPESVCSLEHFCYETKTRQGLQSNHSDSLISAFAEKPKSNNEVEAGRNGERTNKDIEKGQLTLEDCIDMDVDNLTSLLERKFQALKSESLEFFVEARSRFKTRAVNDLNQERLEADKRLQNKCEEIHLFTEELCQEKNRNKRLLVSLNRLSGYIALSNNRKRTYRILLTVIQSWYQYAKSEKRLKNNLQRAIRYYCTEYQQRRVFVGWLEFVHYQHRVCSQERFQAKLKTAALEIEAAFNEKYSILEEENKTLKEQVQTEAKAKSKLEEDMQQAFMRGVCALNMEALSVMKRGMPPTGINPFYKDSPKKDNVFPVSVENPESADQDS